MFGIFNFFKKNLIVYGIILICAYVLFRIQLITLSPWLIIFSIFLFFAELFTVFHVIGFLYSLWPRKLRVFEEENNDKNLRINIFLCVCGEPYEVIRKTLYSIKETVRVYQEAISPSFAPNIVVLNDGYGGRRESWHEIATLCNIAGVHHVMRHDNTGFKAGNINNAIRNFPTDDPHNTIDIVFDADMAPVPEFLLEIVKPLADQDIEFIQTPQRYEEGTTWVARAASAHQYFFFDKLCPAKGHDNAMFLCGTNFAIRRSALNAVGGFDERFITEDFATSLRLHLLGRKGYYLHKDLAFGIAPPTLRSYFSQQKRWSKGTLDSARHYFRDILFGPLTLKQKFHYLLASTYYLVGIRDIVLLFAPVPYLLFNISLMKDNSLTFLTFIYGPFLFYNLLLYITHFKQPLKSLVLDVISFPVYIGSFISSFFRKNLDFIVTSKNREQESILSVYKIQLIVAALLLFGFVFHFRNAQDNMIARYTNYFWVAYNSAFILLGFTYMVKDRVNERLMLSELKLQPIIPSYLMTKTVIIPVLILGFLFTISRTPEFRILASRENMQTYLNSVQQKEVQEELLVPSNGVYYGYYTPELNSHPDDPYVGLIPGEKPSLVMYYQGWGNEPEFDLLFMGLLENRDVVPVITWEPWSIEKAQEGDIMQPEYAPKEIVAGTYDAYIRKFAKEAAAYKKPFFLRFAHEMNGNWYPWGDFDGSSAEDYKKMWRHVHDIFEEEGATNAIWVWSPNNTDAYGSSESILSYYPGSAYVDWVGFSGFNWGTASEYTVWTDFSDIARDAYGELAKLNKPIMVTETSSVSVGGDKGEWFEKTITEDIPALKNVKAVIFFNDDYKFADFSLQKGMNTYRVLYNSIVRNNYYISHPLITERVVQK